MPVFLTSLQIKNDAYEDFYDEHYSVHKVKGSDEIHITHKTNLLDYKTQKYRSSHASRIQNASENLLWPIFGKLQAKFRESKKALSLKPGDSQVSLGGYNTNRSTLIYTIFVCRNNLSPPNSDDFINVYSVKLTEFQIIVCTTFLISVITTDVGRSGSFSTSDPVYDGEFSPDHKMIENVESFQPDQLLYAHYELVKKLIGYLVAAFDKIMPGSGQALLTTPDVTLSSTAPL